MTQTMKGVFRRRLILLSAVLTLLGSIYAFTYSGRIESNDMETLFDATSSLVRFGDTLLDESAWYNQPDVLTPASVYPLMRADTEPLPLIMSAPLYLLASWLPGVGLVHMVWWFNTLVTLVTAGVLFGTALRLGYQDRTAVAAALMFGAGTIYWPYTRTLFREPLAGLFILVAALCLETWRASGYRNMKALVGVVAAIGAGLLTKEAAGFALPALVVLAMPPLTGRHRLYRMAMVGLLSTIMVFLFGLAVISVIGPAILDMKLFYGQLGGLVNRSPQQIETMHLALHTYLLSIGASLWATSPILLAVPIGLWMLWRQGRPQQALAILTMVVVFAGAYAALRGVHWFGGLSWPPRFLVPVVPFVMLGLLPVLERLFGQWATLRAGQTREASSQRNMRLWVLIAIVIVLIGWSLWVQFCGVSLPLSAYGFALPPESGGFSEWGASLNEIRYARWVVIPALWGTTTLDFIWTRMAIPAWPMLCIVVALAAGITLWRTLGQNQQVRESFRLSKSLQETRRRSWAALPLVGLIGMVMGLVGIQADPLYDGGNSSLQTILPILAAKAETDDVLILADNQYQPFFLNFNKLTAPRVIALPDHPGEQPSPEQAPLIRSANPDELLVKSSVALLHNLANAHPRLWVLAGSGPWTPWTVRPVERFMTMHYYPIAEYSSDPPDPTVRLIEYSTLDAPDILSFRGPDIQSNLRFGDSIRLMGVSLPGGTRYRAGDTLAISLYWEAEKPIEQDYTVAWFLADAAGSVWAQGQDTQPVWGFAPTRSWSVEVPVIDNRALIIPDDLQPGTYAIWARLYESAASDRLLPAQGDHVRENTIGILPVAIDVVG
jgi:hypothetical protein